MDASTSSQRSSRHYVVVVHGIGEQRHNETTVEVVHRFAEARSGAMHPVRLEGLMPADLSSQSIRRAGGGQGWTEFGGIPVNPQDNTGIFDGTRASGAMSGRNFRFVDLRWADILQEHAKAFSSPPEEWAKSRVQRLSPPFTPINWLPIWAMPLLQEINDSVLPARMLLKKISHALDDLVFNSIIGDVHLYGDYARTRGQAVRRFHWILDEIVLRDYEQWCRFERKTAEEPYVPPVFTVLAHSLGTVLSFDALVYAFANPAIRSGSTRHAATSIPFPGYTERDSDEEASWRSLLQEIRDKPRGAGLPDGHHDWSVLTGVYPSLKLDTPTIPPLLWRAQVRHFVSLGSPIDKFHVLWHHNYRHMGLMHGDFEQNWAEDWLDEPTQKILHYNLCDEQDPVGHHLDTTTECQNYRKVFRYEQDQIAYRDVVFRRYPIPGAAHVQYWKDRELFKGLLCEVIDGHPSGWFVNKQFVDVPEVYNTALVWAYFRIPLFSAVLTGALLSYGWISLKIKGFALAYAAAIAGAILLWVLPSLRRSYAKELGPGDENDHAGRSSWFDPWKPRAGLLANLVRGVVAWRRILIWLNELRDYRVERTWRWLWLPKRITKKDYGAYDIATACQSGQRLFLKTDGGFWGTVWWRVGRGVLAFVLAAIASYAGSYVLNGVKPTPEQGWNLGEVLQVGGWAGMTISLCYLATMGYVGFWFYYMKHRAPLDMRVDNQQRVTARQTRRVRS